MSNYEQNPKATYISNRIHTPRINNNRRRILNQVPKIGLKFIQMNFFIDRSIDANVCEKIAINFINPFDF